MNNDNKIIDGKNLAVPTTSLFNVNKEEGHREREFPISKLFYESTKNGSIKVAEHNWPNSYIFSNFYTEKKPLLIDGKLWLNTEQYFQAKKFDYDDATDYEKEYFEIIMSADSSSKIKALASQRKHRFGGKWKINKEKDERMLNDVIEYYKDKIRFKKVWWEKNRVSVMIKAIVHKFTQYEHLKSILINEIKDGEYLVENTVRDKIWGDGGDKGSGEKGLNYLGKILTLIRYALKYGNWNEMETSLDLNVVGGDCLEQWKEMIMKMIL